MRAFWRRGGSLPAVATAAGLALLAGCGDLITGDPDTAGRKNYAVIVGISSYQTPGNNLKWADEDALDVYDALRRGRNWETDKITLLTNASATKDAIKGAIGGLAKRVGADDQVVFYFSGRGTFGPDQPPFDEGDGLDEYLVPSDGLPNSPGRDISDDELEALFSALPTNNILIVLDTGFTGTAAGGRERFLTRAGGKTIRPRGLDGMSHDLARPGYVFISSAQAGETGAESNQLRNGVFTYYFAEGLKGAANPGKNAVSAQQAFEYAAPRTTSFAGGQMPLFIDNRGKAFRLAAF